jgi:hypothetical protein
MAKATAAVGVHPASPTLLARLVPSEIFFSGRACATFACIRLAWEPV